MRRQRRSSRCCWRCRSRRRPTRCPGAGGDATAAAAAAVAAITTTTTTTPPPPPTTTTTTTTNNNNNNNNNDDNNNNNNNNYNNNNVDDAWKFFQYYPRHYITEKLGADERIVLDGQLNDAAWDAAAWTEDFVDITNHSDPALNFVPAAFQTRVKMRWDADYLYVGAELCEPFLFGNIVGHNLVAPYHDNDFEVFVDVSGTAHYYKEFEMNMLAATYDVNWGAPDGMRLKCAANDTEAHATALPVCVNTSFPGYPGNWSMHDSSGATTRGLAKGLVAATHYNQSWFGRFSGTGHAGQDNVSRWTAEIAFPIRSQWGGVPEADGNHGGLLDTTWSQDQTSGNYSRFDPNAGDAGAGRPQYWRVDFARAEHPRRYNVSAARSGIAGGDEHVMCPLDCPALLTAETPVSLTNPTPDECIAASREFPTILGTDPYFGCYWEWVWQPLGFEAYMHRPTRWSMVQFLVAGASSRQTVCHNVEWPGRYVAKLLFEAQSAYAKAHGGTSYAADVDELLSGPAYCQLPACSVADLRQAIALSDIFQLSVTGARTNCTATPCYNAAVRVNVPAAAREVNSDYRGYTVTVDEVLLFAVQHDDGTAPCL